MVHLIPDYNQPDFNYRPPSKRRLFSALVGIIILILAGVLIFSWSAALGSRTFTVEGKNQSLLAQVARLVPFWDSTPDDKDYAMPKKEKNRFDVILFGIRGKDDPDGGLLTDTVILFSFDRVSKKATMTSLPRDLYVKFGNGKMGKLNEAYERLGLAQSRELFSRITGVFIDNAIVFDFAAFKHIVDAVGGVDVILEQPFQEPVQWGYPFSLPAGSNHLNGTDALYYVRSRYSSSDFDRANRQQKVILALKNKLVQVNLLADSSKILEIVSAIRNNIQTDFDLFDIAGLLPLARDISNAAGTIKKRVLTTEDLLYEDRAPDGLYILLPRGGSFAHLKVFFANSFNEAAAIPDISPKTN